VHLLRAARLRGTQTVTLVYVIIRVYLHRVCIYLGQRGYKVHKTVTLVYVIIRVYLHRVCIYLGQRGYKVHKL